MIRPPTHLPERQRDYYKHKFLTFGRASGAVPWDSIMNKNRRRAMSYAATIVKELAKTAEVFDWIGWAAPAHADAMAEFSARIRSIHNGIESLQDDFGVRAAPHKTHRSELSFTPYSGISHEEAWNISLARSREPSPAYVDEVIEKAAAQIKFTRIRMTELLNFFPWFDWAYIARNEPEQATLMKDFGRRTKTLRDAMMRLRKDFVHYTRNIRTMAAARRLSKKYREDYDKRVAERAKRTLIVDRDDYQRWLQLVTDSALAISRTMGGSYNYWLEKEKEKFPLEEYLKARSRARSSSSGPSLRLELQQERKNPMSLFRRNDDLPPSSMFGPSLPPKKGPAPKAPFTVRPPSLLERGKVDIAVPAGVRLGRYVVVDSELKWVTSSNNKQTAIKKMAALQRKFPTSAYKVVDIG